MKERCYNPTRKAYKNYGKKGVSVCDEWLKCCTEAVDDYEARTGKKDRDSVFAEYVRKYGRRERNIQ